jgi:serine/threonine-protein kinase
VELIARLNHTLGDRYRIDRLVGRGGMASVFAARDLRHDRPVALKVLHQEIASAVGAQRFLREIRLTAGLEHPHIVPLHDSGEVDGTAFFVMRYIDGESLRARLERERQLPVADAVRIATEVANALEYAHRRGVIHRDIKPENILLRDGEAFVADFGIALAVAGAEENIRLTASGLSLGTPAYMSPEQATGERHLDARTDVFALGAVLYEMLAGTPPFTGPTAQAIIARVLTAEPTPLHEVRPLVPQHVATVTHTALNKLPADRFVSAGELAVALATPGAARLPGTTRFSANSKASMRDGRMYVAAAAIALTGAAVGALLASSDEDGRAPVSARIRVEAPESTLVLGTVPHATPDGRLLWATRTSLIERSLLDSTTRTLWRAPEGATIELQDISPDGSEALIAVRSRRPDANPATSPSQTIQAIPLRGGQPRQLADSAQLAAWGQDGFVYFAYIRPVPGKPWPSPNRRIGFGRVPETGGAPATLWVHDTLVPYLRPPNFVVLPAGRGVVAAWDMSGNEEGHTRDIPDPTERWQLRVLDNESRAWRTLGSGGPTVAYVDPGYLLFGVGPSVLVAPFDVKRLEFSERPVRWLELEPGFDALLRADEGVFAYRGYQPTFGARFPLAIADRQGRSRAAPNIIEGLRFVDAMLSPDGRRVAMLGKSSRRERLIPDSSEVAVYDLPSGPMRSHPIAGTVESIVWTPDGDLAYTLAIDSARRTRLVWRSRDGRQPERVLHQWDRGVRLLRWLADGRVITRSGDDSIVSFIGSFEASRPDSILPLGIGPRGRAGTTTVSADGRFLAYDSFETGRWDVFVEPLSGGARVQVSPRGGCSPRWSARGHTLFFSTARGGGLARQAPCAVVELYSVELGGATAPAPRRIQQLWREMSPARFMMALPGDTTFLVNTVPVSLDSVAQRITRLTPLMIHLNFEKDLRELFATRASAVR